MIFPNLCCPGARPRPRRSLRLPALLQLLRVLSRRRADRRTAIPEVEKRDAYGPYGARTVDPVVEAST
jgi:hypothetical protein